MDYHLQMKLSRQSLFTEHYFINYKGDDIMKKIFGLFFMLSFVTSAIGINVVEVTTSKEVGLSKLLTKEEALMLDSIKVDGYVSIEDISFLNGISNYGRLTGIDLSDCTLEDNALPIFAFYAIKANAPQLSSSEEFARPDGFGARVKYISLPEGLERIGDAAFSLSDLMVLDIPRTVKHLGNNIVGNCKSLKMVKVAYTSLEDIYCDGTFDGEVSAVTLMVPKGTKDLYLNSEAWNTFGAIVEYDDVNGIGRLESGLGAADGRIYTIDGRYAGTDINALGHGMYIMDGRKVLK